MCREGWVPAGQHFCLLPCSNSRFLFKILLAASGTEAVLPCSVEYLPLPGKPHGLAFILQSPKSIAVSFLNLSAVSIRY